MQPNSNSAKPSQPGLLKHIFRWLFIIAGAVALFIAGQFLVLRLAFGRKVAMTSPEERIGFTLVNLLAAVFLAVLLMPLFRRAFQHMRWVGRFWASLFTWCTARRVLVGVAVLATLIAIFYAVENWRGKRAWEQCKRDLAAKGELLDWTACIPAPIPDDENIIKAPKMAEWFVRSRGVNWGSNAPNLRTQPENLKRRDSKEPILIAQVLRVPADAAANDVADVVVRFGASDTSERLREYVADKIGPCLNAVQGSGVLLRQPLDQLKAGRVLLQAGTPLDAADVARLLPTNSIPADLGRLRLEPDGGEDSFRVLLAANPTLPAEESLSASDRCVPDLELIREALKRPHLRMDDDYQRPFDTPIVNYVTLRNVAQTAAQRAQCCLLLGRSEQALQELSLIFELRRLLAARPTLLVASMIDVAISGLCVETIADGFRLQAWRESELTALQEQLRQINFLESVAESFRVERVAACHTLETTSAGEMAKLLSFGRPDEGFWKRITNPVYLLLKFAPRGWVYLNLAATASLEQHSIEIFDSTRQIIAPQNAKLAQREFEKLSNRRSPSKILAAIAAPNFIRATQTTARNQSKINQALIVCGLERYHLTHGGYPDNLDALVPQFLDRLPHDVIGGGPLKYRRTDASHFQLYSVGWNEKDEGGTPGKDSETGDWVWPMEAK